MVANTRVVNYENTIIEADIDRKAFKVLANIACKWHFAIIGMLKRKMINHPVPKATAVQKQTENKQKLCN